MYATYLNPSKLKSCDMWSSAVSDIGQAICKSESRTMISQAVTCGMLDSQTRSERTSRHRRRRVRVRLLNRGLKLPISSVWLVVPLSKLARDYFSIDGIVMDGVPVAPANTHKKKRA